MRASPLLLLLALGCSIHPRSADSLVDETPVLPDFEASGKPSARNLVESLPSEFGEIDAWFEGHESQRVHVQLDRPLYKPGETVWLKGWSVGSRALQGTSQRAMVLELVNPKGQVVETKRLSLNNGKASNDFVLAPDAAGGKWMVRATLVSGEVDERPFVVSNYVAPRIRKELDFVRKSYGAGDTVEALVELLHAAGGPVANHTVHALLQVDGVTVVETDLQTDATGAVLVSGALPKTLSSGDGLLTVLVEHAGITESISRSIPIVLADLSLEFFPEGGQLVDRLPGRVYFEGQNRHGEPADVEGYVTDDTGKHVADFQSVKDGMGRLAFTPERGRTYAAHIVSPPGIDTAYPLPVADAKGCVLRSYDDVHGDKAAVRVGVRCSSNTDVIVAGYLREAEMDLAGVRAGPGEDAIVHLKADGAMAHTQGAVRVTVFDGTTPVAERLIYRNAGKDLRVELEADLEIYGPRDLVTLSVRTMDPEGHPVSADLALSVVDDTVLSLADDKQGHMLSRIYLEPELVDSPKDLAWYYDRDETLAHRGLDLLMGTRGWRRFDWERVWTNEPVVALADTGMYLEDDRMLEAMPEGVVVGRAVDRRRKRALKKVPRKPRAQAPMAAPPQEVEIAAAPEAEPMPLPMKQAPMDAAPQPAMDGDFVGGEVAGPGRAAKAKRDDHWGRQAAGARVHGARDRAAVRVFPAPDYSAGFSGTRTDFRDTVHWAPDVHTDDEGQAQLSFYLSDAITTFRVTAEGIGAGHAGRGEQTVLSVLPVSIATKLPPAVSAGDRLDLPVIVSNTRDRALRVSVTTTTQSPLLEVADPQGKLQVAAHRGATWWVPVEIGQGSEVATIRLSAEGGGVSDTVEHTLNIVPPGFPRSWSAAGETEGTQEFALRIDDLVDHTLTATVKLHPSPVSTLIEGMEGLIREPGGCFEQTSSTNWPNVAILNYLEAHDGDPRLKLQSGRALQTGYDRLTGYQVDSGGFETFGSGPGKEVLSAFGLLQFRDMSRVFPVEERILSEDAEYLISQRNGKGGFKNSGESSHGYGSAPQPVLDGFITWSLVSTGHEAVLTKELARQEEVARASKDPYVLALAARSLGATGSPTATKALDRLAAMQAKDGSFPGAESSITRSYEANLLVESTALASLALMESGTHRPESDRAAAWLIEARQGAGTWGATQATALALNALTSHAELSRAPRSGGLVSVEVNGEAAGTLAYEADQSGTLEVTGLEAFLTKGDNTIVLRHEGESLPFTVDVGWTALNPESAPGAELDLKTNLSSKKVNMGETVRLTARIDNLTKRVVPSPIARIRIPAGLEAQTWQLEQLQERGEIAFFETRAREVTLYWEGLGKGAHHTIELDLVAFVAGRFTGPASSAYPYYNDDEKAWDGGLEVVVARK